ncbi:hypothetical protein BT63DRAFT_459423 [Microthyrium microscopicum]|uniref:Uncharacterized protein n=1 Tax=Microthyrium microscopicum TaxID=703497 RepID=A0A6A6U2H1_9PEZI|nr:hypothetical protein BT63DRAFT_459423 [Microthyrium microscopicum]
MERRANPSSKSWESRRRNRIDDSIAWRDSAGGYSRIFYMNLGSRAYWKVRFWLYYHICRVSALDGSHDIRWPFPLTDRRPSYSRENTQKSIQELQNKVNDTNTENRSLVKKVDSLELENKSLQKRSDLVEVELTERRKTTIPPPHDSGFSDPNEDLCALVQQALALILPAAPSATLSTPMPRSEVGKRAPRAPRSRKSTPYAAKATGITRIPLRVTAKRPKHVLSYLQRAPYTGDECRRYRHPISG